MEASKRERKKYNMQHRKFIDEATYTLRQLNTGVIVNKICTILVENYRQINTTNQKKNKGIKISAIEKEDYKKAKFIVELLSGLLTS